MAFFEGNPTKSPAIDQTQAKYGVQYLLDRVGAGQRMYPRFRNDDTEVANKDLIDGFVNSVRTCFEQHFADTAAVENNSDLSREGKAKRMPPIQKATGERFDKIVLRARNLQDLHIEKGRKIFELPPEIVGATDKDRLYVELRCQEVRRHLATLTIPERIKLLLSTSDPELLHACDTAPVCLRLLPPTILERSKKLRVQIKRGPQLRELEDERLALVRVNEILNGVIKLYDWINPSKNLYPLPDPASSEDDIDPVIDPQDDAAISALSAEMAQQFAAGQK